MVEMSKYRGIWTNWITLLFVYVYFGCRNNKLNHPFICLCLFWLQEQQIESPFYLFMFILAAGTTNWITLLFVYVYFGCRNNKLNHPFICLCLFWLQEQQIESPFYLFMFILAAGTTNWITLLFVYFGCRNNKLNHPFICLCLFWLQEQQIESPFYLFMFILAAGNAQIRPLNSLGPGDAIWHWRSWSTLIQVMACCLTAPSHHLNQCWLIIRKVLWHSSS